MDSVHYANIEALYQVAKRMPNTNQHELTVSFRSRWCSQHHYTLWNVNINNNRSLQSSLHTCTLVIVASAAVVCIVLMSFVILYIRLKY